MADGKSVEVCGRDGGGGLIITSEGEIPYFRVFLRSVWAVADTHAEHMLCSFEPSESDELLYA